MELEALSVDCIAEILSRTTPRDAGGLSVLSSTFRSAAAYHFVWDRFLPPDIHSIISPADLEALLANSPSRKALYLALSGHPIIIDQDKKSFQLDRKSGKKCYMLAARALSIVWGDTPKHWTWIAMQESRFPEVANLIHASWLEVRGMISTNVLSPNTQYAAYLVFKMINPYGFAIYPTQLSVDILGVESSTKEVCLDPNLERRMVGLERPRARSDGWLEIAMGEFFNSGLEDREVRLSVVETKDCHWKNGLFIEGIEVRPKEGY